MYTMVQPAPQNGMTVSLAGVRLRLSLTPNFISGFCCAPPVTQQLLIFSNLYMLHLYQLIHAAHVTYLYLSLVTIRFVLFMYVTQ